MSDKDRQKKDGQRKDKKHQAMREEESRMRNHLGAPTSRRVRRLPSEKRSAPSSLERIDGKGGKHAKQKSQQNESTADRARQKAEYPLWRSE
jgi:hypothetical protein